MTHRVTMRDLDNIATVINNSTGRRFVVGHAYGQPRLEEITAGGGYRDVSPRLPTGQLRDWMHAFLAGIDAGKRAAGEAQTQLQSKGSPHDAF